MLAWLTRTAPSKVEPEAAPAARERALAPVVAKAFHHLAPLLRVSADGRCFHFIAERAELQELIAQARNGRDALAQTNAYIKARVTDLPDDTRRAYRAALFDLRDTLERLLPWWEAQAQAPRAATAYLDAIAASSLQAAEPAYPALHGLLGTDARAAAHAVAERFGLSDVVLCGPTLAAAVARLQEIELALAHSCSELGIAEGEFGQQEQTGLRILPVCSRALLGSDGFLAARVHCPSLPGGSYAQWQPVLAIASTREAARAQLRELFLCSVDARLGMQCLATAGDQVPPQFDSCYFSRLEDWRQTPLPAAKAALKALRAVLAQCPEERARLNSLEAAAAQTLLQETVGVARTATLSPDAYERLCSAAAGHGVVVAMTLAHFHQYTPASAPSNSESVVRNSMGFAPWCAAVQSELGLERRRVEQMVIAGIESMATLVAACVPKPTAAGRGASVGGDTRSQVSLSLGSPAQALHRIAGPDRWHAIAARQCGSATPTLASAREAVAAFLRGAEVTLSSKRQEAALCGAPTGELATRPC